MLDFAELVVLNKYDRRGAEDALRDVRKQTRQRTPANQNFPTRIRAPFRPPGRTLATPGGYRANRLRHPILYPQSDDALKLACVVGHQGGALG